MQTWQWLWVLLLTCCPLLLLQLIAIPKESTSSQGQWEVINSKITKQDQHDIIIPGEALLCKSRSNDEKVVIVWNMYIKAIKMGKGAMWEKGVWGEIVSFGLKSLGAWVVLISMLDGKVLTNHSIELDEIAQ
ncbi:hypothetical protein IW261DRAFT_1417106 [Armillaria novae-zelandiae]|uniref:Uncharacterized protein n=1 Tax=Armillaria novae-zelandiae TaxID=153914 RepID=A0AA39PG62_9AGAR|nr:hypothetical protein IW261DRAFT_1417106 [Armillaria novae-zelandiae]